VRVFSKFYLQLMSRYIERINTESYWVYDMRCGADFNTVNLAFDVNNVFNQTYFESGFVPMPGRVIRFSINWKWNESR
jgi:vitamin B12 transporter